MKIIKTITDQVCDIEIRGFKATTVILGDKSGKELFDYLYSCTQKDLYLDLNNVDLIKSLKLNISTSSMKVIITHLVSEDHIEVLTDGIYGK